MALPLDVVDPGNVNVEQQAFGQGLPAQVTAVGVQTPSSIPASTPVVAANLKPGLGIGVNIDDPGMTEIEDQNPYGLGVIGTVSGAAFKPGGLATDVTSPGQTAVQNQNPIGTGLPKNVNV